MNRIVIIAILSFVAIFQSCTSEFEPAEYGRNDNVSLRLDTRTLQIAGGSLRKVRIIAYHQVEQRIKFNRTNLHDQSTIETEGLFNISIPAGMYTLYAIVNEPDNLTASLDGVVTESSLRSMIVQPETPFTETNIMLTAERDVLIGSNNAGNTTVDGVETKQIMMSLQRVYTKVSLIINKATIDPDDKFTIKKVELVQAPAYSHLAPTIYAGTSYLSRTLFNGSIDFLTNGEQKVIVKETPSANLSEPSNIFPEYILTDVDKGNHDKAAYFSIMASYTSQGSTPRDVYYNIPIGDYNGNNAVNGAGHDYNLKRNYHYELNVKITKIGDQDAVQVQYNIEDWKAENLDVEINGDPFLDVSNVEVEVYDAAATRIYFYSNMPDVKLDNILLNGTQTLPVNDVFENLAGIGANNFTYTYDPVAQRGEGYLDLINIYTDNVVNDKRLLYLKAEKLVREISVTTRVSAEAAKKNAQSYIGTFHRWNERSERILSWYLPTTMSWELEVVTDNTIDGGTAGASYYADAAHLRIDRLASPNHSKLYTLDPPDPEGAFVTDDITVRKLKGKGRVYLRVGWATIIGEKSHRFAKIKVTTRNADNSVASSFYLYCRQGESPRAIVSNTTVFSSYNVSDPENFVNYPTKTGYIYQWNRVAPWAVTGAVNNYPLGDVSDPNVNNGYEYKLYSDQTYICPAKYAYPDAEALSVMNTALKATMYQWGYYADGFFDRRAISNHFVRNTSGEIGSAGGIFFSPASAVAIFLPTASWRTYDGVINGKDHQEMGVIGHYWSMMQESEWNTPVSRAGTVDLNAWALHLTQTSTDSYLEKLNKASAANVRCMMLSGNTFYFDANGGLSTPRSITKQTGLITVPQGPMHRDPVFAFDKWTENRNGSGAQLLAGASFDMGTVTADKIWYAQYKKVGYDVGGKVLLVSAEAANTKAWTDANQYCTVTMNTPTSQGWRLPTHTETQALHTIEATLFTKTAYWTSTLKSSKHVAFVPTSPSFAYDPGDANPQSVRCVREL